MNSAEKKQVLQSVKAEIDEYFVLESKLNSLKSQPLIGTEDPDLSAQIGLLQEQMNSHLRKIVETVEKTELINDMPKEIKAIYLQFKEIGLSNLHVS